MKRIYLFIFVLVGLSACTKKEFDGERVDDKLNRLSTEYHNLLTSSPNGWIAYLFPEGGGGYTFKFKFDDKNRVSMYATMDYAKATTAKESSYRIKADQVISLYFDTYSYLHILSDPDPDKSGGAVGAGLVSDFEFAILEAKQDTLRLKGNHNGSEMMLIRAKSDQGDDYIANAYAYVEEVDKINQFEFYHNKLIVGDKEFAISINTDKSTVSFYYEENGVFKRFTTEYAVGEDGLMLRDNFVSGNVVISTLYDFSIDQANGEVDLRVDNNVVARIENVQDPVVIDRDAPRRMYIETYEYYSSTGATYAGQRDALNLGSIPGFVGIYFIARYFTDPYDVLFTVYNNGGSLYGPAFRTTYGSSGVMKFTTLATLQGTPPGAPHTAKIQNLAAIWGDPDGYYVYQTGKNYFDLVSVYDSRLWFRFN